MTLQERLAEARAAGALARQQVRAAGEAIARYRDLAKGLGEAGASPQEIAAAVGVPEASIRHLLARRSATEPACSFCGRAQHEVVKIITGPGIFICDGCVERARAGEAPFVEEEETSAACGFCQQQRPQLSVAKGARVCHECLDLCVEIILEEVLPQP